ncbi:response regulator transcription factor [Hoeflea sp. J2-29]|uniref:Response regulator transcription factor n=2 Tax=Hoeflea ulvae TaxID=2983764 RepID=A0ABT3YMF6_9HYPH|nr:response regulator transcription factor [Hoeflea ulvae]
MEVSATSLLPSDVHHIASSKVDLVVIDPGYSSSAFQSMRTLGRRENAPKILVFAMETNIDYAVKALDTGASGYLPSSSSADELMHAMRTLLKGDTFISPGLATRIISAKRVAAARKAAGNPIKLSVRESQIVEQLKLGRTNREIAGELGISEKTVKHYMTLLMEKVNARNRLEVAMRVGGQEGGDQAENYLLRRKTDNL